MMILSPSLPPSLTRLHEFVWHGTDRHNKTKKILGGLRFTNLRVIPDQFYYNTDNVRLLNRNTDDATLYKSEASLYLHELIHFGYAFGEWASFPKGNVCI